MAHLDSIALALACIVRPGWTHKMVERPLWPPDMTYRVGYEAPRYWVQLMEWACW
jgi:hypothetical protein